MDKVIAKYIEAALQQEKASAIGDHKSANKAIKIRTACVIEFSKDWTYLKKLMDHENKNVRLWSAYDLLSHDQCDDKCLEVMREISKSEDILGLGARMALKRYNLSL